MSENTATAPGRWTNPALLQSLMVTFYGYAKDNIDKDAKEAIIQKMHGEGFEYLNWDMLRIKTFFMAEKTSTDGKWANPVLLEALVMGFHSVTKQEEGLSKDAKDEIVSKVHLWGFVDITWEGIRQHIQKLQRMEAAQANDNGEGPSTSAPATPKKTAAKKTATPRKRKTPAKKAKSEEDDEDNAEEPTPKKLRAPERPTFAEDLTVVKTDDGSI